MSTGLEASRGYLEQKIRTADHVTLVVQVLDLASMHLAGARAGLAAGNLAAKGREVGRASRCLDLLQASLDLERGGEIARNLDRVYGYLLRRLSAAHAANDDAALAEISGHLSGLASAWREAAARQAQP